MLNFIKKIGTFDKCFTNLIGFKQVQIKQNSSKNTYIKKNQLYLKANNNLNYGHNYNN